VTFVAASAREVAVFAFGQFAIWGPLFGFYRKLLQWWIEGWLHEVATSLGLEWRGAPRRWQPNTARRSVERFERRIKCPHCGRKAREFRLTMNALVCGHCARSFDPARD
jgi:hypothetical protein